MRRSSAISITISKENRSKLDSLAHALLEHETLDQVDAYAAAGMAPEPVPA